MGRNPMILLHLGDIRARLNYQQTGRENWWHISTQKPPNVGSSSAISEPIIAGLVSARGLPNPMKLGSLTLFYTLGLLYWVGLGNIQPTQILLYWVQQAEHRLHREVAGMIGLDCNHNYQSPA